MKGRKFEDVDHDAWLNKQMEENCPDRDDERYDIIKEWLGLSDEEMEEIDLDVKWDSYLEWKEECRAEYNADFEDFEEY